MKIVSLSLKGFRRMSLGNIGSFTITPVQNIQLVLGTNGSGKSSLMGELTPLPPDPSNYLKEGSKTITIEHRGNTYILKSWFAPSQKHSFLKNNEELNPGGTVTVQKELVRQQFGVTQEIHDLLTGLQNFTTMSPAKRREWFTLLSDVSYDYALQVYARLKERSRDLSGALKLAKKRLVSESEKVVTDEEIKKLTEETHQIAKELDLLQTARAPLDHPVAHYRDHLDNVLAELRSLSGRLLKIRLASPHGYDPRLVPQRDDWGELKRPVFKSLDDVDSYLAGLRQQISVKQALISKSVKQHEKFTQDVEILIKTGAAGKDTLLAQQHSLRLAKSELLLKKKLGLSVSHPEQTLSALESIWQALEGIVGELPSNEDRRYSSAALARCETNLRELKDRHHVLMQKQNQLASEKAHLIAHKQSPSVECPKCTHSWVVGYSEAREQKVDSEIAHLATLVGNAAKQVEDEQSRYSDLARYAEIFRDYIRLTRSVPVLDAFWSHVESERLIFNSPKMVMAELGVLRSDLAFDLEAAAMDVKIEELSSLVEAAEKVGDASLAESKSRLDGVTAEIEELTHQLSELQQKLADYDLYRKQLAEGMALGERIKVLKDQAVHSNDQMVEMIRRETIAQCIRHLQSMLARKEETLSAVSLQKGIIGDLEQQIAELAVQEEAAKQLVRHLSPTDGLIADGLMGFIRSFTGQMNQIIKKIWSYPLIIRDCSVSGDGSTELDYKFPLSVHTNPQPVPDISKGSSGMQEIINLAFKIVAMKYLHLSDSPLFLDEFAARFDPAHKASATELIKNLMFSQPFTQLFMVSHDYGQYGALAEVDVCVICANNISVPSTYNHHVTIE
jgi:DNA repair exonuclease SbcCD ATPase subunit